MHRDNNCEKREKKIEQYECAQLAPRDEAKERAGDSYLRRKPAMVFRAYASHKRDRSPMIKTCPTTGKL